MRRCGISGVLAAVVLLCAHVASAQSITGAPPIPQPVLSTDQIFIFRGQAPVYSTEVGNLLASLAAGTVQSVSNTDHSLTISPTVGNVIASCTTATTSQKGCVSPDGSTITISGGVITAFGAVATTITVGTTNVASGVSGDLLFNNSGKLGNETLASLLDGPPAIGSVTPSAGAFSPLTVTGSFTATGLVTLPDLATQAANSVLGNATAGIASPTALAMTDCHVAGDAVLWTANTGFGCATGYSTAVGANPTATAGAAAVNGLSVNFMRADAAPAVAKATNAVFGIVEVDGTTITSSAGLISCTTATVAQSGCAKPDGTTITISGGVITAVGAVAASIGVGTTTISTGTPGSLLYDNGGVLGNETFAAACTNATGSAFGCVKLDGSTITANSGIISAVQSATGTPNVLRGTTLSQWYSGTGLGGAGGTITVGTSITWTAEGIACLETGATITASRVANPLTNPLSYYALKLAGATSNTDVACRFVIESFDAAAIAGQASVTFQLPIQNKTGGAITPTISTFYPTLQDGSVTGGGSWSGGTNADLTAQNLQTCNNNATCTLSYTFAVNPGANNGYEVVIHFGAITNTTSLTIGGGFDLRPTPGVATGLNNSPPPPDVYSTAFDAAWNQRFLEESYPNGVAAGNTASAGSTQLLVAVSTVGNPAGSYVRFASKKRATPTVTLFAPVTGTQGNIYDFVAGGNVTGNSASAGDSGFNWYGTPNAGTFANFGVHWIADARIAGG